MEEKNYVGIGIVLMLIFSVGYSAILVATNVYDEVDTRITSNLCLSCLKLDPPNDFGWEVNENPPNFVLQSLDKTGPLFLAYRTDVCEYCDDMEPVIMNVFNITFKKEDVFSTVINFNGTDVTFAHINLDHASGEFKSSRDIYDIQGKRGLPMFTIITLKYYHGIITPHYNTIYGKIKASYTNEERIQYLKNIMNEAIKLYNDYRDNFIPDDFR